MFDGRIFCRRMEESLLPILRIISLLLKCFSNCFVLIEAETNSFIVEGVFWNTVSSGERPPPEKVGELSRVTFVIRLFSVNVCD